MEFSVMYPEMDKFRRIWNLGENCVLLRVVGVEENHKQLLAATSFFTQFQVLTLLSPKTAQSKGFIDSIINLKKF